MVRVLHPNISKDTYTTILRGLPEGSRLSPTLFEIVAADLIRFLRAEFPDATISHAPPPANIPQHSTLHYHMGRRPLLCRRLLSHVNLLP